MEMESLQKGIDEILHINRDDKPKNWFVENSLIPLGSKRPYHEYKDGKIPDEDVIYLKVDKTNITNMLIVAPTGIGKTRFTKRLAGYYQKHGYNILAIDPKSYEYMKGGLRKGKGARLHPYEENEKYNVSAYCPAFVKRFVFENENLKKRFSFYSPSLQHFTDVNLWRGLGAADKAANFIVTEILRKNFNLTDIAHKILKNDNLMTQTKRSSISAIAILQDFGFFDSKYKDINIKQEWKDGNMVAVSYFSQQGALMSTDIANLIKHVREIGNNEQQNNLDITPKFILFDDSLFYAIFESGESNNCLKEISNAQNNYRSLGVNTCVVVQNPNFIDPNIIDGCTTKIIWGIENPESLRGLIPSGAFELLKDRQLVEDEEEYLFEAIIVRGRRKYETFFPFDCIYYHGDD